MGRFKKLHVLESDARPTNKFLAEQLNQQDEAKRTVLYDLLGKHQIQAASGNRYEIVLVIADRQEVPDEAWYEKVSSVVNEQLKDIVFASVRTKDDQPPFRNTMGSFRLRKHYCCPMISWSGESSKATAPPSLRSSDEDYDTDEELHWPHYNRLPTTSPWLAKGDSDEATALLAANLAPSNLCQTAVLAHQQRLVWADEECS